MSSRARLGAATVALASILIACGSGSSGGGPSGPCTGTLCSGACVDTQTDSSNCGTCGNACAQGLTCQSGVCAVQPGSFGTQCATDSDCNSKLCLPSHRCSKPCSGAADCPSGAAWSCQSESTHPQYPSVCFCSVVGPETCDGVDDDCDGRVDNGATCSQTGYTCQNGACACGPKNLCGGTCVDTQTDTNNCGGCGVTCAGRCELGRCQVTLINDDVFGDIVVNASNVYFVRGGVMKMGLDGGTPEVVATDPSSAGPLALDATNAYWFSSDGALKKVALSGGTPVTLVSGSGQAPYALAVDGTSLYWTDKPTMSVEKVSINGGTPVTLASSGGVPRGIAVDATSVYWASWGLDTLFKAPLAGGTRVTLATNQGGIAEIAVDATGVYWQWGDSLMKVGLTGGTPQALATVQTSGVADTAPLALDGTSVYWGFRAGQMLLKVPRAGGTPVTLVSRINGPEDVAVGANAVYYTTSTLGSDSLFKVTPK